MSDTDDEDDADADAAARARAGADGSVRISVSKRDKHTLPVDAGCPWWRPNKIVSPGKSNSVGCETFKGSAVEGYSDLIGCLQEANCEITGNCRHT